MNKFSPFLKKKKPLLKQLIKDLNNEFEFISILGCDVTGKSYTAFKGNVSISSTHLAQCGFVARVYKNGVFFEHSFSDIDFKTYEDVKKAIWVLGNSKPTDENVAAPCIVEEKLEKKFRRPDNGHDYTDEEVLNLIKKDVEKGLAHDPRIINTRIRVEANHYSKLYVSKDRDLEQFYTWNYGQVVCLAKDKDNIKSAYSGFGEAKLEKVLTDLELYVKDASSVAIDLLSSQIPTPGIYTVVTDPSITGLFAHEAFGHGLEMDQFVKDRAKGKEFIGKSVASNLLSMHDGASSCISAASYFFDDEGTLAQDTLIIDKGILKGGICDAVSGAILGYKPTGNGRRESYKRKVYTRMTNTFFSKGKSDVEKIISSVKHGYYVVQTDNGMEDPKNWGIQCTATYGREIVDGKFTGKIISPVVMSGYVIDFLNSISMIGKTELVIGNGSCGKGYKEWVPVADGGAVLKAEVKIG